MDDEDAMFATLLAEQERNLNKTKVDMRAANEAYLAAHPELQILVSLFTKHALEAKPKDPMAFACKFFMAPEREAEVMASVDGVGFDMGVYAGDLKLPGNEAGR